MEESGERVHLQLGRRLPAWYLPLVAKGRSDLVGCDLMRRACARPQL
jgi:hypothetical protein